MYCVSGVHRKSREINIGSKRNLQRTGLVGRSTGMTVTGELGV